MAAIVSGLVSALGWFVNSWQQRQVERSRREERIRDFQVALRAEIGTGSVIEQVVMYARLRQAIERFVGDLRSDSFRSLPAARQLTMYADYLGMLDRLEALAQQAIAAIDRPLLNSPGEDRPTQGPASAPDGARASVLSEQKDEP